MHSGKFDRTEEKTPMFKFHMIGKIIRNAGLGYITAVFIVAFFACAAIITFDCDSVGNYGTALWVCFQTVSTIGFGDVPIDCAVSRVVVVLLSIMSIFYLAVITGAVVAYCTQMLHKDAETSIEMLAAKAEHLEDLSKEELAELSKAIRKRKR